MNITLASILLFCTCISCSNNTTTENHNRYKQNELIPIVTENQIDVKTSSSETKDFIIDKTVNMIDKVLEPKDTAITNQFNTNPEAAKIKHDYSEFNQFLKEHVSNNGKVNYGKIKQNLTRYEEIVSFFENSPPLSDWSKNEKLSYWINSYNAYTLYFVARKYPVKSIIDINPKPWDVKFIPFDGALISLNDIEHKKIRGEFNEARIHFALNCASESCPQLLNKAFTPSNLNGLLNKQTKLFLDDYSKNNLSDSLNIKISSIFDWYEEDFTKNGQNVISFIQKYNSNISSKSQIEYMEYSWLLND